jgi:hypothetical protein
MANLLTLCGTCLSYKLAMTQLGGIAFDESLW